MRSVPIPLLWSYISSASGLKEWFADKVTVSGKTYTFEWNGQQQSATVLGIRNEQSIRFRWDDSNGKDYFEMRISVNELTDSTRLLWWILLKRKRLMTRKNFGRHRLTLYAVCSAVDVRLSCHAPVFTNYCRCRLLYFKMTKRLFYFGIL